MEDRRKFNGGHSTAGRKSIEDKAKANELFISALNVIYRKDNADEDKIAFIVDLLGCQRGQIFVAEHLFGKATEIVENNLNVEPFDIKSIFKFSE
jgi:hypothetical protein